MPVTIEDVASSAGVSVTTVSHVFSGNRPVSAATKKRVERVAKQLGYRPSAIAKSLREQRTDTVMIILPDITNPFYPDFARGAQDVLREAGYHSLLSNTDGVESEERSFLEEAFTRRVDGIIFMGFRIPGTELDFFSSRGQAIVSIGPAVDGSTVDSLRFDDENGAHTAVSYLLRTHRTVAFINGDPHAPVSAARREGYEAALAGAHIAQTDGYVVAAEFTRAGGQAGMRELLDLPIPPSAVFCANDLIALGAMDIVKQRELRIPEDVAIMGCDDIDLASAVTPPLTTVRHPASELGRRAAMLLLSRMRHEYQGSGRHVVIPTELIVRDSA